MLLLAVETSTARSSVALATEDGVVASAALDRDRRHGEFLAPALQSCLHHLGASTSDLTAVAAGTGPGLYTGLRVGLVTAATIGTTLGLPAVGVAGPHAMAHRARHVTGDVAVVLDARRREVYWGRYRADGDGGRVLVDGLHVGTGAQAEASLMADGGPTLVVGDGVHRLPEDGPCASVPHGGADHRRPDACDVAALAVAALARGATIDAAQLRPVYLRDADAKIGWGGRSRLAGGATTA